MTVRTLTYADEPQQSGAIVAVHYGNYRDQEVWGRSGANIGNWYPLGGEFGAPKVAEDTRSELEKIGAHWRGGTPWHQPPGTVPLHPTWSDVLARGPVTLLVPADDSAYRLGWVNGRRDLWQGMEEIAEREPDS